MFKKVSAVLLAASLCASVCALPVTAAPTETAAKPELVFNGLDLQTSAVTIDGTTCLPIRALFEAMGCEVSWSREQGEEKVSVSIPDDSVTDVKTFDITTGEIFDNGRSIDTDSTLFAARSGSSLYASADLVSVLFPLSVRSEAGRVLVDTVAENSLKVENKTLSNKASHLTQSANYPVVSGLTNAAAQAAINTTLKAAAEQSFKNGQAGEAENTDARKTDPTLPDSETDFSYAVVYNQNGLLSFLLDEYQYQGGAHGSTIRSAKTFDIATGKELSAGTLFSDWAGAKKVLNAAVSSGIAVGSTIADFSSVADDDCICPTNSGLRVCFQQYQYFPYAAGIVCCTIPWSALKTYLAPVYSALAAVPAALDAGRTNVLTVGQTAASVLPSNATTGYSWHLTSSDEKVVSALSDYYVNNPASAELAGAPALGEVFVLKANGKGTATVTLKYYRGWEGAASADRTVSYKITVS